MSTALSWRPGESAVGYHMLLLFAVRAPVARISPDKPPNRKNWEEMSELSKQIFLKFNQGRNLLGAYSFAGRRAARAGRLNV